MTIRSALLVVLCSAMLLGGFAATPGSRDELPVRSTVVSPFRERLAAYTQLRQQIMADLMENGIDPKAGDGREFRNQLAAAIREARRQSQPGEIFCPEVAGYMRRVVWDTLRGEQEILADVPAVPNLRVNDFYPEGEPLASVPASLLERLEPLPQELQYRFLATALILLDIDTALIVDFLPNAIPRSS